MKQNLAILLCAMLLLAFSACANSESPSEQAALSSENAVESAAESGGEVSGGAVSDGGSKPDAARPDLLQEADGPVPEFLDAELQALYRRAKTAYVEFTLDNAGFGSGDGDDPAEKLPLLEMDGMRYYKCNGSITKWTDFESAMLSVFTPEYYEELNNGASYTDDSGVLHKRTIFAQHNGDLYYSGGGRGGNMTFIGPETFAPISSTDSEIQFYVVGVYDDYAEDAQGNLVTGDDGEYLRAGNPTQEKHRISMVKTPDGWRVREFHLAY